MKFYLEAMKPQNTLTKNSQYVELVHWNGMTGAWKRFFVVHVDKMRGVCSMRILDRKRECLREVERWIVRVSSPDGRYRFKVARGSSVSREVAYAFKPLLVAVGMIPTGVFTRVRNWEE